MKRFGVLFLFILNMFFGCSTDNSPSTVNSGIISITVNSMNESDVDPDGIIEKDDAEGGEGTYPVEKAKSIEGWSFKTLLEPKLEPGGQVHLISSRVEGIFKILEVTHKGSTHGSKFQTEAKVRAL